MATQADERFAVDRIRHYQQYGESLKYIFRVDIYPPLKYSVKENKTQDGTTKRKPAKRILALSCYRLLLIKRTALNTKKVTKDIHFYDLHEIQCDIPTTVCYNKKNILNFFFIFLIYSFIKAIFLFRGKHANKSIEMKSGQIPEIIQKIRMLYESITMGYSSMAAMKLNVVPEW